jgi:hypothetical protein
MVKVCQLTYRETCSHAFVVMHGREPSNSARKPLRTAFASGDQSNFHLDRILAKHPPIGKRTMVFPKGLGELCLATGPEVTPLAKLPVRVVAESGTGVAKMLSAGSEHLGAIAAPVNPNRKGLLRATVMDDPGRVLLSYLGPDDLWQSAAQAGVM